MSTLFDEKTKFAWPVVLVIGGGVMWLTALHAQVTQAHQKLDDLKAEQAEYAKDQKRILHELARIQGKMGIASSETDER